MSKRSRSVNWDEEEKQLFRSVLKDYAKIIEDKTLNTNNNKLKSKAWEEVHQKFNSLNSRERDINQLKIQWKGMKINARKKYGTFKRESNKTGGGTRPPTPEDADAEVKDLLNPAELLIDHNIYDSDGMVFVPESAKEEMVLFSSDANETALQAVNISIEEFDADVDSQIKAQKSSDHNYVSSIFGHSNTIEHMKTVEDVGEPADDQKFSAEPAIAQDTISVTPIKKYLVPTSAKTRKVNKSEIQKITTKTVSKSRKDHEYVTSMVGHSKRLKDEEHMQRIKMADEEHAIKMAIHQERLKCVILERKILEKKLDRSDFDCEN